MKFSIKNIDFKNEKTLRYIVYAIFAFLFFCKHYDLVYVGDDLIMGPGVDTYTLWDNLVWHWDYNGRIITDVFANIWYRIPMMCWKIFDTALYVVAAMLISRVFTKNRLHDLLIVCGLLLLFPFNYMESAGYIATSANYFYPVLGIFVITRHIKYVLENEKVPVPMYFASAISIIYFTNHDQTAVGLLGCMVCYLVYCVVTKADKRLIQHVSGLLGSSAVIYGLSFLIPGHMGRTDTANELETWFPEYVEWNFADKVYHGYTSTVANLFYNNVLLFVLFAILLFMISLKSKSFVKIIVAAIPIGGILLCNSWGSQRFIYYFERSIGMPELLPLEVFPLAFILSIFILISIFYTIWNCVDKLEDRLMLTMLLVMAAGTREMMGFTFTIYASSYRTFTFFLYALIICSLILLRQLEEDKENKHYWYIALGALGALLLA